MTELEEFKTFIVDTMRDEELASSAYHEAEAYAKLWPFVFVVNDWNVWSEGRRALRLQVVRWLEDEGASYDFHQFGRGLGLVGFKDHEAAARFERRWLGKRRMMPASYQDWNPHPVKSTFEPHYPN